MKRLTYNAETQTILEELAENDMHYWRYQHKHHNGLIPVGHTSHERMYEGEEPESIEEGCSCYNNPYQLFDYVTGDVFYNDIENYEVVIFCGRYMGTGLDEEDIVLVEEESDILYSLNLKDFYKFCKNCDIYFFGDKNLKEYIAEQFDEDFAE